MHNRDVKALALLALVLGLSGCSAALGGSIEGPRRARVEASPQWAGDEFRNALPETHAATGDIIWAVLTKKDENAEPVGPVPLRRLSARDFATPPESGLRVTWLGHSTVFIEIDGGRFLFDPIWSERCSPVSWTGPTRFHPPPLELEALPRLDGVIISHDHYDHLDYETILRLRERSERFYVPLGVGAHLEHWGVPASKIVELDWWQAVTEGAFTITATPARHFSGRSLGDRNQTLWAGWAVRGPNHNVFFSGDTAMFPGFADIGTRLGPFDVALLETGQYNDMWRDVHLGPEQAVVAFEMLRAERYVPVHWGTFSISLHGWTEPVERLLNAAERLAVPVVVPRPGEPIEPAQAPELARWWPELPYRPAEAHPVMSSGLPRALRVRIGQAHGFDGAPPTKPSPCRPSRAKSCARPSR